MPPYERFSPEVCEKLGHYVYKLIDPRNGQVFYIGQGQNNRVFDHVEAAADFVNRAEQANADDGEEDEASLKIQIINAIHAANLKVICVIHRHGIRDAETAFEVEAALIDATPGHAGISGHGSDRGPMNARQIIDLYAAEEADFGNYRCIIIRIRQEMIEARGSVYETVRWSWRVNPDRARQAQYIIAARNGLIVGVFVAHEWHLFDADEGRYGFTGEKAPQEIWDRYVGKRLPADYMQRGAANPIQYVNIPFV